MSADPKKQRTPGQVWRAIEAESARDEIERIAKLSSDELDAELRALGVDPERVGAEGAAFAEQMFARREREIAPTRALARSRARLAERAARRGKLRRSEIQGRIDALRSDPRFSESARVVFRGKTEEEASDAELETLLEHLEELAEEHEKK